MIEGLLITSRNVAKSTLIKVKVSKEGVEPSIRLPSFFYLIGY